VGAPKKSRSSVRAIEFQWLHPYQGFCLHVQVASRFHSSPVGPRILRVRSKGHAFEGLEESVFNVKKRVSSVLKVVCFVSVFGSYSGNLPFSGGVGAPVSRVRPCRFVGGGSHTGAIRPDGPYPPFRNLYFPDKFGFDSVLDMFCFAWLIVSMIGFSCLI
jgi:hypothetical protein